MPVVFEVTFCSFGLKLLRLTLLLLDEIPTENDKLIVSIEAGSVVCWYKYLKKDDVAIGIDKFGKSAPYKEIYEELNLTSNKIASLIQKND